MQFGASKWLLLRFAGLSSISVVEPPPPRRLISVLVANFCSSNAGSGSGSSSGQFTSRRLQHDEGSRDVRVSVWWDFENCHLPADANVLKLTKTITASVRMNGIKGPITMTAFGDVTQLSRTNQEALSSTGISLTHVPQGGKNSTDKSLIADLMCWVSLNPPPAHLFLISSDRDFASVLHKLRMSNYNILLAGKEEQTKSGVLCSAASIMWDWNDLVRGISSTGKHFNQPPDGPYNSWYGQFRTPLLDPFATSSTTTKEQSCTIVKAEELREWNSNPSSNLGSSKVCVPIPEKVVRQISFIVSLYPKGAPITELREQLSKRNVRIDKDFYGHKSFSRFLLSMPEILQVVPMGDGMFLIRTQRTDNKASSAKLNSQNTKVVCVEKIHPKVKETDDDVKEESQSEKISQECAMVNTQKDVKAKYLPVKENHDDSVSNEKYGFLNKLYQLWFGSPEMEMEHLQEKKHVYGNGDEGKGIACEGKVVDKNLESQIASSTSSESAKEVKAENGVDNGKSASSGLFSRFLKRFMFSWGRNTELSNAEATGTQVDDVFATDSFWNDVESFINSPRGFVVVSHSRSREAMAKSLKDEGPSSLKPLDVAEMLDLVSLLISEKKWIKENPSSPLPFRVSQFTEKSSCLSNPCVTAGLRSIFVNMSKSQFDGTDDEKTSKNIGTSQKPLKRSRTEVIRDCHKLVKKITEENRGGYNMSNFKKDFLEKFGYRLDYQNLGHRKLQSLIQMMPEARIESGYIVPSSMLAPYESDSSFEELGPVSEKVHEYEPTVSEKETEGDGALHESGGERKKTKNGDDTKSDLLQLLGSWDTGKDGEKQKKPYGYGEDKLVEGILISLAKKPPSEPRIV